MDSKIPDIRPEVNKEPEEEDKKKAGFWVRFFRRGGGEGAVGAGAVGAGGFGGLGGAASTGGLLATKAGLLALILAGSTVAGGIGLVGYRFFGPGAGERAEGGSLSLFAPKPKDLQDQGAAAGAKDGNSRSLSMFASANAPLQNPDAAPAEAPQDATAAGASAQAGAEGSAGSAGGGVNKIPLGGARKLGELSKNVGGGGSSVTSAAAKAVDPAAARAAGQGGSLGSFAKNRAAAVAGGRSLGARASVRRGVAGQALGVLRDNRAATSSAAGGRTYDGAAANNSGVAGPGAGGAGVGGPGVGTDAQPKSLPNSAQDAKEFKAPPAPETRDVTPWKNSIQTAQMLIGLATLILLACQFINKAKTPLTMTLVKVLGGIVAAIGAAVTALGSQIATGPYGQTLQGGVLAAAGAGLILAGGAVMFSDVVDSDAAASGDKAESGILGGINPFVLIGGGLGLIGLVATMLIPPKRYPSTDFQNGRPPDTHWFG